MRRRLALVKRPDRHRITRRLRAIGVLLFTAGVVVAGRLYWLGRHRTGPTIEELIPGVTAANARQMRLLYGNAVQLLYERYLEWSGPAGQAVLVVAVSALAAVCCFRLAWLREHGHDGH